MNRSIFLLSILSIALLTGCETLQNTWSGTKTFYRSYLNTPATIDYEEKGFKGIRAFKSLVKEDEA